MYTYTRSLLDLSPTTTPDPSASGHYRARRWAPCVIRQLPLASYFIHGSVYMGEGDGTPLQYSCLENPMDGGAWWAAVHGVPKSQTWLSDFTFTFHFHALEKEMATHSSVLAWRIPGMEEPGGLPPMGSHRVGHDWSDLAAAAIYIYIYIYIYLNATLSICHTLFFPVSVYESVLYICVSIPALGLGSLVPFF